MVVNQVPFELPRNTHQSELSLSEEGVKVKITGKVDKFNANIAREKFGAYYEDKLEIWEDKPFIQAQSIEIL